MKAKFKYETIITISLIIIYILINSYCMNNFGLFNIKSLLLNLLLSISIIIFILKNKLLEYYNLTKIPNFKKYLYFIPLLLIVSVNLWNGININNSLKEIIIYILIMINISFLEEIIFRGFLFKMLEQDNYKSAIIVSSLTFGIGHIINLLTGSLLISTILQVLYATTTGFLFSLIVYKGKSLWPPIICHILTNVLSIFYVETFLLSYIIPLFLIVVSSLYSIYIIKKIK